AIEHHVEDPLSEHMLRGEYADKNRVIVSLKPTTDDEEPTLLFEGVSAPAEEDEAVAAGEAADAT
ncbi:MAG: hypothetical protein ACYSVY_05380, partial [Planctomycetota bacterium]